MSVAVAYRHAAYDTPWWALPSSRSGRYHRGGQDTTQYLSLHPLGPSAEVLRNVIGPEGLDQLDTLRLNLWAVLVDVTDVVEISFGTGGDHGIAPEELVAEDWAPTQELADRLRVRDVPGIITPSAALPGTGNLVLFGPRVAHPYLALPVDPVECPTGHLSDAARPPVEVAGHVRWIGTPHAGLEHWLATGEELVFEDPLGA